MNKQPTHLVRCTNCLHGQQEEHCFRSGRVVYPTGHRCRCAQFISENLLGKLSPAVWSRILDLDFSGNSVAVRFKKNTPFDIKQEFGRSIGEDK